MVRGLPAMLLFLVLLLPLSVAAADAFTVSVEELNTAILPDESVIINLVITNTQKTSDTFRISVPDVLWNVQSEPLYYFFGGVDLAAGEKKHVRLFFTPTRTLPAGPYKIDFTVSSQRSGEKQSGSLFVRARSSEPLLRDYLAAVARIVDVPASVDPREEFAITVNLENRNPKNISKLEIRLSSDGLIDSSVTVPLGPLERKTVNVPVRLDPLTPPQEATLQTTIIADGDVLSPELKETFRVAAYADVQAHPPVRERGFLKTTTTLRYSNDGNVNTVKVVEQQTNFFRRFFTSAPADAYMITRDGKRFLAWELQLEAQESKEVVITESYRPPFLLLMLAIAAYLAYRFFRSALAVRKEATVLSFKEGGISEVKVLVHVQNRSPNTFSNITVTDTLPYITDVEKDIDVGTLKPTRIQHSGNTTTIVWNIDSLEAHEERILSYHMRSKLSILGGFVLPATHLQFYDSKGAKFVTRSKPLSVKA